MYMSLSKSAAAPLTQLTFAPTPAATVLSTSPPCMFISSTGASGPSNAVMPLVTNAGNRRRTLDLEDTTSRTWPPLYCMKVQVCVAGS